MHVLAVDTCFAGLSVAVATSQDGGPVLRADTFDRIETGHAERLMPAVEATLERAQVRLREVSRIAVTLGPGSFTGIRVGIAAARALALALEVPVVGMSSLEVAALEARSRLPIAAAAKRLAVVMDARRGGVYAQVFSNDAAASPPRVVSLQEAVSDHSFEGALLVGSGAALLANARGRGEEALLADLLPLARHLAMAAPALSPLAAVTPLYLRAADAHPPVHFDLRG